MSLTASGRQVPARRDAPAGAGRLENTPYLRQNFCYKNFTGHQDTDPAQRHEQAGLAPYLDGSEIVARRSEHADMTYCCPSLRRMLVLLSLVLASSIGARAAIEDNPSSQPRNRLAIVIGNSDYKSTRIEDLANAANDATKLSESLKRLNFDVLLGTDVSAEGFAKLFSEADAKLGSASSVLIFYAGHGVQLQGQNYLLPVDTPDPESIESMTAGAIKLNDVIARFSNRDRQTFLFLNSAATIPFATRPMAAMVWRRSKWARTRSWRLPRSPAT